jgi:transcriptional regulator with XRE-family HTH domain
VSGQVSKLLRSVRVDAGLTQLELSLRLGVSQRHLSFVEQARARPSRPLLLAWLRETGCPPALVNAALLQAGFAPLAAPAPHVAASDAVLLRTIALHDPYPGLAFDADWRIVRMNAAALRCWRLLMPALALQGEPDMLAVIADERGWLARCREPRPVAAALLAQLRAEQWLRPGLAARVDALERAWGSRFGDLRHAAPRDPSATSLSVAFDTRLGALSFDAVQMQVGLPHDAAGARLRGELWFPADAQTARLLRRQASADEPIAA